MTATTVSYERQLSPDGLVLEHRSQVLKSNALRPWRRAVSSDSVSAIGYVVYDGKWLTYFAPDLDLLVSDQFVAAHCFRLNVNRDGTRIGIEFEPVRERRKVPEIAGTIWVERGTSELREIEFRYVNVPGTSARAAANGMMNFVRLPNDAWIIQQWSIRMPILEKDHVAASGYRSHAVIADVSLAGFRVEGGYVGAIQQGRDTIWRGPASSLAGVVVDSANVPVVGAAVSLRGAGQRGVTDARGAFSLADIVPGRYRLDVQSPLHAALSYSYTREVDIADRHIDVQVRVPSPLQLSARLCGTVPGGVIAGRVLAGDSLPGEAVVLAEWREGPTSKSGARAQWTEVRSDVNGAFRLCGMPLRTAIRLSARSAGLLSSAVEVHLSSSNPLAAHELLLRPAAAPYGVLQGRVLADIDGSPIAGSEISIPKLHVTTFANESGAFRLPRVPYGDHTLHVRRLGFREKTIDIRLSLSETQHIDVLLARVPTLDTVAVEASPSLPGFDENRAVGLGSFLTREQLQSQEGRRLSEILSQVRGVAIVAGVGNRAWVGSTRGGRSTWNQAAKCREIGRELEGAAAADTMKKCNCFAQVYLDGQLLNAGYGSEVIPDINQIPVEAIEAIEYYAGPAQTPLRYSRLNSECGVLVIHRRRTW